MKNERPPDIPDRIPIPPRDGAPEAALVLLVLLTLSGILIAANREVLHPLWGAAAPWMIGIGILGLLWWCGAVIVLFLQHRLVQKKVLPPDFKWLRLWNIATIHDGFSKLTEAVGRSVGEKDARIASLEASHDKYVGTTMSDRARRMASQDELGGAIRRVFVMFSDVRGFTRMTGQLKPEETVEILNTLFTDFEHIIREHGGEINKYIGDAAFAYFRMPHGVPEAGVRAVLRSAVKMQERFEYHNERFKVAYSKVVEIGLGIGVTAGEAVLGNVGSTSRMEFTLIGEVVNLASRLCSVAKHGQILLSEAMAEISMPYFELAPQPPVELKGIDVLHKPWLVLGEKLNLHHDIT